MAEGQNAVHFSGGSFWPMGEGQNAVHFSGTSFYAMRRYGIAIAPDRQPGMAPLLQSLIQFSTPAMVAQAEPARLKTRVSRVRTAKPVLCSAIGFSASASA